MVKKKEETTSEKKEGKGKKATSASTVANSKVANAAMKKATDLPNNLSENSKSVINKDDQQNTTHSDDHNNASCCHGHDHKCKCCFAFIVILLIAACAVAEYLYDKHRYTELSESNSNTVNTLQEAKAKIDELNQKVDAISKELVSLENKTHGMYLGKYTPRQKWKVWTALKSKLEAGETFDAELKVFYEVFSYDNELLQIVNETVKGLATEEPKDDGAVMEAVKKYVNKVVKIGKVDHRKLLEISGYVITSIEEK
ncbi:MAG: hypothetical protein IJT36_04365 [Alphaproteobacteria bacterium]|nr:hypothetical protein [Alphaproteobacteria bacterium]